MTPLPPRRAKLWYGKTGAVEQGCLGKTSLLSSPLGKNPVRLSVSASQKMEIRGTPLNFSKDSTHHLQSLPASSGIAQTSEFTYINQDGCRLHGTPKLWGPSSYMQSGADCLRSTSLHGNRPAGNPAQRLSSKWRLLEARSQATVMAQTASRLTVYGGWLSMAKQ